MRRATLSEQLALDGSTETERKLTDRQRFALELIRELGPVGSDELGAYMHERRGKHSSGARCRWCGEEGKTIGRELRKKKPLGVKERRGEGWHVGGRRSASALGDNSYDPSTAPIPF